MIDNKETLKKELVYYISVFDKTGKRISNTFQLPKGVKSSRQLNGDRLLVNEHKSDGSMEIRWFDINNIIK